MAGVFGEGDEHALEEPAENPGGGLRAQRASASRLRSSSRTSALTAAGEHSRLSSDRSGSMARGPASYARAAAAATRTLRSEKRGSERGAYWRAAMRACTARGSLSLPNASAAAAATPQSSSLRAAIRGSTARVSLSWPRASAAASRTENSESFSAAASGSGAPAGNQTGDRFARLGAHQVWPFLPLDHANRGGIRMARLCGTGDHKSRPPHPGGQRRIDGVVSKILKCSTER